jgi:hypothetical protein
MAKTLCRLCRGYFEGTDIESEALDVSNLLCSEVLDRDWVLALEIVIKWQYPKSYQSYVLARLQLRSYKVKRSSAAGHVRNSCKI